VTTYSDEWHREFGRHSGIPECCVEAFLSDTQLFAGPEIGYSPCNACVHQARFIVVLECGRTCDFLRDCGGATYRRTEDCRAPS
jgi:hypothetical protein